jgi:hypothetical protein
MTHHSKIDYFDPSNDVIHFHILTSGGDVAPQLGSAVRHAVTYLITAPRHYTIIHECSKGDDGDNCIGRSSILSPRGSEIPGTVDKLLSSRNANKVMLVLTINTN